MKRHFLTTLLLLACLKGYSQLATYTFTGASGTPETYPPDAQPANGTLTDISRGAGIGAASASGAFSANGWPLNAEGFDPDAYFSFSLQANSGYELTITSIKLDEKRSSTGIREWSVRSSIDGFTTDIANFNIPDDTDTRTQTINLTDDFNNLESSTPIEFRIYGMSAESSAGSWRLDNIEIYGQIATPDTDPPFPVSADALSSNSVVITFNEAVDQASAESSSNYLLNGSEQPVSATRDEDITMAILSFSQPFESGVANNLLLSNIMDVAGNTMINGSIDFTYLEISPASFRDLVINEIMADPSPPVGLPDAEYIEIFNRSPKNIDLMNYTLNGDLITDLEFVLRNGEYVILTDDSNAGSFSGNVIGLNSMGALTNGGETITLHDQDNSEVIDTVSYSNWYNDGLKEDGGYSLELINPFTDCSGEQNWTASNNPDGGTPGIVNSVYDATPDTKRPDLELVEVVSPAELLVTFNEPMDENSLLNGSYNVNDTYHAISIDPVRPELHSVMITLNSNLITNRNYELTVSGVTDCPGNLPAINNVEFYFDNSPPGIISVEQVYFNEIFVEFDEPVDVSSAEKVESYKINPGSSTPTDARLINERKVLIIFDQHIFSEGADYIISSINVADLHSNIMDSSAYSFNFQLPRQPATGDIIINEIMADPSPPVGLPEVEYVELFNPSGNDLNLNQLIFSDANSSAMLPSYNLENGQFALLVPKQSALYFKSQSNVIEISNFPALNNSLETITLQRRDSVVVETITYTTEWYRDALKEDGGYSLERISPSTDCRDFYNWKASLDPLGGTPGFVNSVQGDDLQIPGTFIQNYELDANHLTIEFSTDITLVDLSYSTIKVDDLTISQIKNEGIPGVFKIAFNEMPTAGTIYSMIIDGLPNCDGSENESLIVDFGTAVKPEYLDLLITEIMPHPLEGLTLPFAEYVEIFNSTDKTISLSGVELSDASGSTTLPSTLIGPGELIILTSTGSVSELNAFGRTLGIVNWPSLNNSGDITSLVLGNEYIHSVSYNSQWYKDTGKSSGGWSLEMIDTNNPCGGIENWSASQHPGGGTPGMVNSYSVDNPDNKGPVLVDAYWDEGNILLKFNEKIGPMTLDTGKITIEPALSVAEVRLIRPEDNEVVLMIDDDIMTRTKYVVKVNNFSDCLHNLTSASERFFYLPEKAEPMEIVLNEILFNPRPGGVDFVEIYNRSEKHINLNQWMIGKQDDEESSFEIETIVSGRHLLAPGDYAVFTKDPIILKADYPHGDDQTFLQVDLPALPDELGNVALIRPDSVVIDRLTYSEEDHSPLLDDLNGVSLERVIVDGPTDSPDNWQSAAGTIGYATPGLRNSQYLSEIISTGKVTVDPEIITPDNNGNADFATISYSFDGSSRSGSVHIYNSSGRLVKSLLNNATLPSQGFITWDGTNNEFARVRTGYYIVVFRILGSDGDSRVIKKTIVVGSRL